MKNPADEDDDDFLTRLEIAVDGLTRQRLIRVAEEAHSSPRLIAASILRAVLEDDELFHEGDVAPAGSTFH